MISRDSEESNARDYPPTHRSRTRRRIAPTHPERSRKVIQPLSFLYVSGMTIAGKALNPGQAASQRFALILRFLPWDVIGGAAPLAPPGRRQFRLRRLIPAPVAVTQRPGRSSAHLTDKRRANAGQRIPFLLMGEPWVYGKLPTPTSCARKHHAFAAPL